MIGLPFSFKYQLIFSHISSRPLLIHNYARYHTFRSDTRNPFTFTAFCLPYFRASLPFTLLICYLQVMRASVAVAILGAFKTALVTAS